ncbi:hypothetical protein RQP46_004319 [Phenoliferia psychrophenolica]
MPKLLPAFFALLLSYLILFPPSFDFSLSPAIHYTSYSDRTLELYPQQARKMSKVILTGATGSAGAECLRQLLLHPTVSQVTVLSRRELPPHIAPLPPNPKLRVILHSDFTSYPQSLLDQLEGYNGVVWDLGKSSMGVREDEYERIHVDYPIAAAKAFAKLAQVGERKFVFALLTGQGTSQDESKARQMFGRIKGRAEKALATLPSTLPNLATFSFRPAIIKPITPSPDDNLAKKAIYAFIPFVRPLINLVGVVETDVLAGAMIDAVLKGGSGTIPGWEGKGGLGDEETFDNEEIIRLARGSALAQ